MKKTYLLSISDNTLFATCDQEATWDLANLRKKLHGSISQALGDTALEPVELLAIPLYTLNQEVDVTAISVPLFDEIGVRDCRRLNTESFSNDVILSQSYPVLS